MHDEAEIRGHRRTYIGALPGQIIQHLKRVEVNDPVFMLDEIDKLGRDFRGDPASALLETAGSGAEQHVPRQLSRPAVRSVEGAVHLHGEPAGHRFPAPLLDRMEIIELTGYTEEEKVAIATKYLIPRQIKENGIDAGADRVSARRRRADRAALHARGRRAQAGAADRHGLPQAGAQDRRRPAPRSWSSRRR